MTQRPIMDAGPGINFFSVHRERLLFAELGPIAIPEIVETEIRRKSRQDQRFAAAERALGKIPERLLKVLSDDMTEELAKTVHRIAGLPMDQRLRSSKDLGETMVVAHAVVAAESGAHVKVLIDDGGGRRMAIREAARLKRLGEIDPSTGSISLVGTTTVLKSAAGKEYLSDRGVLRDLYKKLRGLDDGLPPLESTGLLDLPVWF